MTIQINAHKQLRQDEVERIEREEKQRQLDREINAKFHHDHLLENSRALSTYREMMSNRSISLPDEIIID